LVLSLSAHLKPRGVASLLVMGFYEERRVSAVTSAP
jgi:hypothetical protein